MSNPPKNSLLESGLDKTRRSHTILDQMRPNDPTILDAIYVPLECPHCGGTRLTKYGEKRDRGISWYRCRDCSGRCRVHAMTAEDVGEILFAARVPADVEPEEELDGDDR